MPAAHDYARQRCSECKQFFRQNTRPKAGPLLYCRRQCQGTGANQPMRHIFYQANFCGECGNALPTQAGWKPRYFCSVCAQQRRQQTRLWQLWLPLFILLAGSGWLFLKPFASQTPPTNAQTSLPFTVTAWDAAAQTPLTSLPLPAPTTLPAVFCGARTKRGTPCRRLVQPGQRCPQHRGAPSILPVNPAHQ